MIQKQKLRVPWLLPCNEVVRASLMAHINRHQHGPKAVGIGVAGGEEQQAEGLSWFRAKERIHSHPSVQQLYWRTRVSGNRGPAKALNSSQRCFMTCESWQSSEEGDHVTSAEDSAGTRLNLGSNTCCICELLSLRELQFPHQTPGQALSLRKYYEF